MNLRRIMKKNTLVTGALLGLSIFSSTAFAQSAVTATSDTVMCHGVNSCKGSGACAGKVDACSGKDGCNAEIKCAGHNSCKGKGLVKLTKKECLDKGGKIATK